MEEKRPGRLCHRGGAGHHPGGDGRDHRAGLLPGHRPDHRWGGPGLPPPAGGLRRAGGGERRGPGDAALCPGGGGRHPEPGVLPALPGPGGGNGGRSVSFSGGGTGKPGKPPDEPPEGLHPLPPDGPAATLPSGTPAFHLGCYGTAGGRAGKTPGGPEDQPSHRRGREGFPLHGHLDPLPGEGGGGGDPALPL